LNYYCHSDLVLSKRASPKDLMRQRRTTKTAVDALLGRSIYEESKVAVAF